MIKQELESLYKRYNKRSFVSPDPLEFLYHYPDVRDREIVGLVASSLAYGRVKQILKSVDKVLSQMPKPSEFLENTSKRKLLRTFADFKHRFTTGQELAEFLWAIRQANKTFGSLENCFLSDYDEGKETIEMAAKSFIRKINSSFTNPKNSLLPNPDGGSALKRVNLFLRWMIRKDAVDPGGWDAISKSKLIIPLDTHMHQIGSSLKFTSRKAADSKSAIEITTALKRYNPEDPTKYDFALTRLGIRDDTDMKSFIESCQKKFGKI